MGSPEPPFGRNLIRYRTIIVIVIVIAIVVMVKVIAIVKVIVIVAPRGATVISRRSRP